jgi:hypothetical protein
MKTERKLRRAVLAGVPLKGSKADAGPRAFFGLNTFRVIVSFVLHLNNGPRLLSRLHKVVWR